MSSNSSSPDGFIELRIVRFWISKLSTISISDLLEVRIHSLIVVS